MGRKTYPDEYREQISKLTRTSRSLVSLARDIEPTEQKNLTESQQRRVQTYHRNVNFDESIST